MSLPLADLRCKLTQETNAVLDAVHRVSGKDKSEIVREVMAAWAESKIHESSLIDSLLKREGLRGIDGGMRGNLRESEGLDAPARRKGAAK
jgi:hypothetical protein